LLDQFAYDDSRAHSRRLWQYEEDRAPWWKASPRTAARWDGHFADPANAKKEAELETRPERAIRRSHAAALGSMHDPIRRSGLAIAKSSLASNGARGTESWSRLVAKGSPAR
jgi:hypothetical protein